MGKNRNIVKMKSNYDIVLVMLVLLLCVFGLVMIYSVSSFNAAKYYDDEKLYFNNQGKFLIIGTVVMLVISMIDYRLYINPVRWLFGIRPIWALYLLCLGLQVYVLIFGYTAGGSSRWIKIPGIGQFQPSELTKICIILFTSYAVMRIGKKINYIYGFALVALYSAPLIGLVAMQNLSTGIVMAGIMVVICFVSTKKRGYYGVVALLLVAFAAVFTFTSDYRTERVVNWYHQENLDPGGQIVQGLYAIASGGLWGKGLGESSQKMGYIQEVHTDMIFTVICEELGIFGAIMVIAIFLMILWRLLLIAIKATDVYGSLIATGIMTHIALQVMLHIAVVTNTIPATGIPFPFISYGGSSLLVLMTEMGIALSVSKYSPKDSDEPQITTVREITDERE